jgi:putative transposase
MEYDAKKGLEWEWQTMGGAMTRLLLGEKSTGLNPTDRRKSGTKRSLLVEGNGIPVGVAVGAANRHDMKLTKPTLESIAIDRPEPTRHEPQNMCMDKGYDYPEVRELLEDWGYTRFTFLPEGEMSSGGRRFQGIGRGVGLWNERSPG